MDTYYCIIYYSNVNVLRNDNNVARVKSKRIETSICSIINIKLSKPIFGRPMAKPSCCGASEPEASERSSSLISVVGSQKVNF